MRILDQVKGREKLRSKKGEKLMPLTKTWYKNSINISFLSKAPFLIIFVELIDFLLLSSLFLQENLYLQ